MNFDYINVSPMEFKTEVKEEPDTLESKLRKEVEETIKSLSKTSELTVEIKDEPYSSDIKEEIDVLSVEPESEKMVQESDVTDMESESGMQTKNGLDCVLTSAVFSDDSGAVMVEEQPVMPIYSDAPFVQGNMCPNCGLSVARTQSNKRKVSIPVRTLGDGEVRSVIQEWVAPLQVTEVNFVCEPCWELAKEAANYPQGKRKRQVAHRSTCLVCGKSVLRGRLYVIKTILNTEFKTMVANSITPRILQASDKVCIACYLRLMRSTSQNSTSVNKATSEEASNEIMSAATSDEAMLAGASGEDMIAEVLDDDMLSGASDESLDDTDWIPPKIPSSNIQKKPIQSVHLHTYFRAPSTSSHCVYPKCKGKERLQVPRSLRMKLLIDYNYLVSRRCRICQKHFDTSASVLIKQVDHPIHDFTAEHIEDFIDLLKKPHYIDFDNILNMDESLVKYWYGFTKEDIEEILRKVPALVRMHRGIFGLGAYLMKLRTGESNEKLAKLLKTSRTTLRGLMEKVKELLKQDLIPPVPLVEPEEEWLETEEIFDEVEEQSTVTEKNPLSD